MGIVIGPINETDWYTLRELRSSIEFYKSTRDPRYLEALDMEKGVYNYMLKTRVNKGLASGTVD